MSNTKFRVFQVANQPIIVSQLLPDFNPLTDLSNIHRQFGDALIEINQPVYDIVDITPLSTTFADAALALDRLVYYPENLILQSIFVTSPFMASRAADLMHIRRQEWNTILFTNVDLAIDYASYQANKVVPFKRAAS